MFVSLELQGKLFHIFRPVAWLLPSFMLSCKNFTLQNQLTAQKSPYSPDTFNGLFRGGHARFSGYKHLLNNTVNPTWCSASVYDLKIWHVHHYHRGW